MRYRTLAVISITVPFLLGAGGALPPLVQDIGVCMLTSGVLAILFSKFRIPSIAAFLLAGFIVGPIGAGLVTDRASIETIAGLGLILLLFLIGLEIDLRKLLASGRTLVVTGLLQFPLSVLFGYGFATLLVKLGFGGELLAGRYAPIYVGFVVAASSTLIVVKLLQERFLVDTTVGRVAIGLLILQDIWAIIVIAVQPNFENPQLASILFSFLGIGLLIFVAVVLAKYLLPIGFRWIAKSPELLLVGAVAWCFGVGFMGYGFDSITEYLFGLNLHIAVSMEMGALIAGATIASLPYSAELISEVGVVKNFFVTLFFVGLGMAIPVPDGPSVILLALFIVVIVLLARLFIFFPLLHWTGLYRRNAMVSAITLAQVSEFSLVIAYVGLGLGHISVDLVSAVIFAFVITALLTPFLSGKADAIHEVLGELLQALGFKTPAVAPEEASEKEHGIVMLGFHRVASSLLVELRKTHGDLLKNMLVVDFDVNIHRRIAEFGPTVEYGDFSHPETLSHVGIDKARVILCTVPDDIMKGTSNEKLVASLRRLNPDAVIIANATEFKAARRIYEAGANFVYLPQIQNAQAILPSLLAALDGGIDAYRSDRERIDGKWDERDEVFM